MNFANAVPAPVRLAILAMLIAATSAFAQVPDGTQTAPDAQVTDGASAPAKPAANAGGAIDASVRSILAAYGSFQSTTTYGEVWIPTSTPPDWRPYAACHWVNSRTLGWYYDDKTPWGAIIHHYGRWTHDAMLGWAWVPGHEFSPGWVSWRTSPDYIGWAPLPPNGDLTAADTAAFDHGGFWTFMETAVFDRGCGGSSSLPIARERAILVETQPVTALAFAQGLWIAVLPDDIVGPLIDISVSFKPWPNNYIISVLAKWNVAWNSVDVKTKVNFIDCKKRPPPHLTQNNPPPRPNPCGADYLQPDGRCGMPVLIRPTPPFDRPPPTCADGRQPDNQGLCGPPPAFLPPPVVGPPPVVVGIPPSIIKIEGCRRPGFVRQPDGHCFNPSTPIVVIPPPVSKPPILVVVPPGDKPPVLAGCGLLSGVAKRRCLDGTADQAHPLPTGTTAVLPARGGDQGRPPGASRPSRPVFVPAARPRPALVRPPVFRPVITRPAFARPSIARPSIARQRPAFRPSRPAPVSHAVFHPSRPQVRARPAPRSAPRPNNRRHR